MTAPRARISTIGLRPSGSRWTAAFSAVTSSLTMISARDGVERMRAPKSRDRTRTAAARLRGTDLPSPPFIPLLTGVLMVSPIVPRVQYRTEGRGVQSPPVMIPGGIFLTPKGGGGPPLGEGLRRYDYFSWNLTVTVKTTGLGRPLMIIGSATHRRPGGGG